MNLSNEHKYTPEFNPSKSIEENAWGIILSGRQLLMRKSYSKFNIPNVKEIESFIQDDKTLEYIGRYEDHDCFCKIISEIPELPENYEFVDRMNITNLSGDPGLFLLAGNANHILNWNNGNQYCGRCGTKTIEKCDERAKVCPNCNNIVYPRISPAIITAIFKDDKILLAHNRTFRKGMYSLIAGYVEPGESLEECVAREIREEVGIKVNNIRYFSSQPWPFPDSLMMAFTAEYESGEIVTDNVEITDARWYNADNLPEIPSTDSIAGKMIRWFMDQSNAANKIN